MPAVVTNALGAAAPVQQWQERFDFLLPRKEWLKPAEVAKALGVTDVSVNNAYDQGRICGHEFNFRGTERRNSRRIPRDAAIIYLAGTANYTPAERLERIADVVETLHPSELVLLQQRITARLRRAQA
jgi:hypothetical protein